MKIPLQNWPLKLQIASLMAFGYAGFLIWDQLHWWRLKEEYSFGFLVPFFVGYVLHDRWPSICRIVVGNGRAGSCPPTGFPPDPSDEISFREDFVTRTLASFLAACYFGGLILFVLGAVYRAGAGPQAPASLLLAAGFAAFLLGIVFNQSTHGLHGEPMLLRSRLRLTAMFVFPAFIWLISAPLVGVVEGSISLFLLQRVTTVVLLTFDLFGLPLAQEGNVLILPRGRVGVAEACSGIRSLTACLFAGSFLAAVYLNRFLKKLMLVSCAMLLAFFTNILRSLFLTGWAYAYGSDAIGGRVHDVTGYAVLGLTCVGLIALLPFFNMGNAVGGAVEDHSEYIGGAGSL